MSTNRCSQVSFSLFFAREQRQQFHKGSNCIFSIAYITRCIQTIHAQFLTEHKSLCSHNGQRPLEPKHWDNTQVLLLQPAQPHTQTEQCLPIAANALHSYSRQKQKPYQQVKPLRPTMKTLSPLVSRLWRFCTKSPSSVINQITYTVFMYLCVSHKLCLSGYMTFMKR